MIEIDLPDVLAEVAAAFERYEAALKANDVAMLGALFWDDPRVLRYGIADAQHGPAELAAFRAARSSGGVGRRLTRTVITTYGRGFATANTEFTREDVPGVGRQSQTWLRTETGWRIVAAHVSCVSRSA